jgi:hypothetical protein
MDCRLSGVEWSGVKGGWMDLLCPLSMVKGGKGCFNIVSCRKRGYILLLLFRSRKKENQDIIKHKI